MVRLKVRHKPRHEGRIKISIPYGSIKSGKEPPRHIPRCYISIPYGSIKRFIQHLNLRP